MIEAEFHEETYSKTTLGFWVYLMTDCVLFISLFTAYAVLHKETFGGLSARELFRIDIPLYETLFLLGSTFTCGLGVLAAKKSKIGQLTGWFILAFLLGIGFLSLELYEFYTLIIDGNSWKKSAFLSSYFTLVGTHGLHVSVGLVWMIILMIQIFSQGLIISTFRRLVCFSLFWHFLDVVWIFIFTFVYLVGAR